jgi:hypothetical protein
VVAALRRDIPSVLGSSRRYTYLDFEIIPVNDITETTRLLGEGVEFRKSI